MGFWEIIAGLACTVVALNGVVDGIRGVTFAPIRFWRWMRRLFRAVDIIASIPGRLDTTEELLAEHIRQSKPQVQLLEQMASDLGVVVPKVRDIHYQVNNNGGGSQKDAVDETLTIARDIKASLDEAHVTATLNIPRPKRGSAPA